MTKKEIKILAETLQDTRKSLRFWNREAAKETVEATKNIMKEYAYQEYNRKTIIEATIKELGVWAEVENILHAQN